MAGTTKAGRQPLDGRAAKAAEARRKLLDAAAELFGESDYESVQVAEIAKRAGVAHGLLFHYFKNKRGIYLAVMRETAEDMQRAFEEGLVGTPTEMVTSALIAHVTYLRDHRGLALRLVLGGRGADPEAWRVFEDARWRGLRAMAELFDFDLDEPMLRMFARAAVAALDEAAAVWLSDEKAALGVDEMVDLMLRIARSLFQAASGAVDDPDLARRLEDTAAVLVDA